jgi:UbiD family decarboxylase
MCRSWRFSKPGAIRRAISNPSRPSKFHPGRSPRTFSKAIASIWSIFPTPKWHEHDGGRYIGTGDMVIIKDPDSGWINVGTYRSCVVAKDRVTLWIIEHKHGKQIARKYWNAGRPCPVAIVLGCEPATWLAAPSAAKSGVSEYEYAGALRGAPLEVIRAPFTGLPIPATAEIVIEGEMPSPEEESHAEGPFGEWPGYYTHSGENVSSASSGFSIAMIRSCSAIRRFCRSPSAMAFRSTPRASGITWSNPASRTSKAFGAIATL